MENEALQLYAITKTLTDKYTGMDSSSVTYETASMLMGAVIYTMNLCKEGKELVAKEGVSLQYVYDMGLERIETLYKETLAIYQDFMSIYEDYGLVTYDETMVKGMEAFFIHYDMRFNPQNHLLSLDYPLLDPKSQVTGIKRIHQYLNRAQLEALFLSHFDSKEIDAILKTTSSTYQKDYCGNLCELVLLNAIACVWVEQRQGSIMLTLYSVSQLSQLIEPLTLEMVEDQVKTIVSQLIHSMNLDQDEAYFQVKSKDFAYRIFTANHHKSLARVFGIAKQS